MSDFNEAIKVILRHEGGWVDHPSDPGGETNFGISSLIIRREGITAQQLGVPHMMPGYLKLMKVEAAIGIYKQLFWDRYRYGNIVDQTAATKVFDCGVNCGPGRAHRMAQAAANACGQKLIVDGILGPATFAGINACDPRAFVYAFADEMMGYYQAIVRKNPRLEVFIRNWSRRAGWGT